MIRWRTIKTVASFEFVSTVKRKGYLIATFGMPIFVLLYGGVISSIGFFVAKKETEVKIKEFFHFRELYPYFLIPAILLLGLELFLSATFLRVIP